jgi:hypothetical protein
MAADGLLSTAELRDVFTREVQGFGGVVKDVFDDGTLLLARSVLPRTDEVQRGDRVFAGVAMRAAGEEVALHPYVFRQVCTNGSIMAQAVQTCRLDLTDFDTPEEAVGAVADAVASCAAPEAFEDSTSRMRTALEQEADLALNLMPLLGRLPADQVREILPMVLRRFRRDGDRSRYGLFNAVTSVARDTRDPRDRWRLEELGGGVLALVPRSPVRDGSRARAFAAV